MDQRLSEQQHCLDTAISKLGKEVADCSDVSYQTRKRGLRERMVRGEEDPKRNCLQTRVCSACKQRKKIGVFSKSKRGKDGLMYECKRCMSTRWKQYRQNHCDELRQKRALWRKHNVQKIRKYCRDHRDEINQRTKIWAKNNAKRIRKNNRRWQQNNPEKMRASRIKWRRAHPEIVNMMRKRWNEAHPDKARASHAMSAAKWRRKHPDQVRANRRKWRQNNSDKVRLYTELRRGRKLNAFGSYTESDIRKIYNNQKGKCYYCKTKLNNKYVIDHKVALSQGGSNCSRNLVVACKSCNLKKGVMTVKKFLAKLYKNKKRQRNGGSK